jgi:hypothetical protein
VSIDLKQARWIPACAGMTGKEDDRIKRNGNKGHRRKRALKNPGSETIRGFLRFYTHLNPVEPINRRT